MILKRPENPSLTRFLYKKCENYLNLALKAYWIFSGYSKEHTANAEWARKVRDQIKNHMVKETNAKQQQDQEYREGYINLQNQFINNLINVARELNEMEKAYRQQRLLEFLKRQNMWIGRAIREKKIDTESKYKDYYKGLVIPLETGDDSNPRLILRIIPELGYCYSTRQRTPYKIVIETIELSEASEWDEKVDEESKLFPKSKPKPKPLLKAEGDSCPVYRLPTEDSDIHIVSINTRDNKAKEEPSRSPTKCDLTSSTVKSAKISDTNFQKAIKFNNSFAYSPNKRTTRSSIPGILRKSEKLQGMKDPFEHNWNQTIEKVKKNSPYKRFNSYAIKAYIVKVNDELRQELLAMQFMKQLQTIYEESNVRVFLRPYEILITSDDSGIIGIYLHNYNRIYTRYYFFE